MINGFGFPDGLCRCRGIHTEVQVGAENTRYLSIYLLRKAKSNLHFDPPKLRDPPLTMELIALLCTTHFYTNTAAAVAVTTQLWRCGL